jgi:serine protease Do
MTRTLLILCLLAAAARPGPPLMSKRVDTAVRQVQPAVVKIFGVKGFRGVFGYMTGVLVHESGLLITRNSVTLEEAPQINCHLHDGRRRAAEIVRYDRRSKMALLRLLGDADEKFPTAKLGDSSRVTPGQFVLLIGNAYKVAQGKEMCAVNMGVVSAVSSPRMRASTTADFHYDGQVILHDAMNNPGVYGGPLANLAGEVIGVSGTIVESRETNVQLHYAIPINDLKAFVDDTLRRPDAPKIYDVGGKEDEAEDAEPGYHGIRVLRAGINRATAAYVDRVKPESPAARAGIRPDDLVLKIDRMRVKTWKGFVRMMARYRAGESVQLTLKRGQEVKIISFKLEVKP